MTASNPNVIQKPVINLHVFVMHCPPVQHVMTKIHVPLVINATVVYVQVRLYSVINRSTDVPTVFVFRERGVFLHILRMVPPVDRITHVLNHFV